MERDLEQRLDVAAAGAESEDVERDERDGDLGQEPCRRRLPPEALLEGEEGKDRPVANREQLAVEDPVPVERSAPPR